MDSFHPAVRTWFARRFPAGPTEPQAEGWQEIAAGRHTLIAAPTGSGKTLAAFLVCIDRIYRAHEAAVAASPGWQPCLFGPPDAGRHGSGSGEAGSAATAGLSRPERMARGGVLGGRPPRVIQARRWSTCRR